MDSRFCDYKQLIVRFAKRTDVGLKGAFEHAHGRRHKALGKISEVDGVAIDEILELMVAF